MKRLPIATLIAAALSFFVGCESGTRGLENDPTPLVTVHARVEGDLASVLPAGVKATEVSLRVGIVWAGVPEIDGWCLEHGPLALLDPSEEESESEEEPLPPSEVAAVGCRDPFGFVPALAGPSVPLANNAAAKVEIPLTHLPTAEVLAGTPDARVAYGAVVIFDDLGDDGALDLGIEWEEESIVPDRVYGASFVSMLTPHTRLVFREGDFDAQSFYYPIIGCEAPPRGFSYLAVSGLPTEASCVGSDVTDAPAVALQPPTERLKELVCIPVGDPFFGDDKERPPADLDGKDLAKLLYECREPGELVLTDPESTCKSVRSYLLKKCPSEEDDPECVEPEWDLTDDPPEWWPCEQDLAR